MEWSAIPLTINLTKMTNFLKNKWLAITIAVLLMANIATFSYFWYAKLIGPPPPPPPPRMGHPGQAPDFVQKELNFSAAQQLQYERLFKDHRLLVRNLKDSVRVAKDDFFSLLSSSVIDPSVVESKAAIIAELEKRIDILTLQHFQHVKAICTPEQQSKFDKIIHTVVQRMGPPPPPPMRPGENHFGDGLPKPPFGNDEQGDGHPSPPPPPPENEKQ